MSSLATYLKPLSAGQIFDRGIRLYRNNFLTFIGIIAIMQIPIGLTFLVLQLSIMNELPGIAVISGLIYLSYAPLSQTQDLNLHAMNLATFA